MDAETRVITSMTIAKGTHIATAQDMPTRLIYIVALCICKGIVHIEIKGTHLGYCGDEKC